MANAPRPIAALPQHGHTTAHKAPFYIPTKEDIHPGPRNHLILSLRSGLPDEVDWALPRLVICSYEFGDRFILSDYLDSVPSLLDWPTRWVEDLERCAALREARAKGIAGIALAAVPEWTIEPSTALRATNSLLVLRNASVVGANAKHIARRAFTRFLSRFFALPTDFILDLLLHFPEPVQHILMITQSIFYYLPQDEDLLQAYAEKLPAILIETRDLACLQLLLPILISALTIQSLPVMLPTLIPHLVLLLSLSPTPPIMELVLDLLISLTLSPGPARIILSSPEISAHLKHLVRLLEHGARHTSATFDPPAWTVGSVAHNPSSRTWDADEASRVREKERVEAHKLITNPHTVNQVIGDTGDRPPTLPDSVKRRLFAMKEPQRSYTWLASQVDGAGNLLMTRMHETFVYSSTSQLMQVAFWHSYREFFTQPGVSEPLLSASEVIKNVTTAFPGASAKVWVDETGTQRFVIAGMGFRRSTEELDRHRCRWTHCLNPVGPTNATQLLTHVHSQHLQNPQSSCGWSTCQQPSSSLSHILTHLPLPTQITPPDWILSNHKSEHSLLAPDITRRGISRLPASYKLHFPAFATATDSHREPAGVAFLSALVLRNLAKTLRAEIAMALPEDYGMTDTARAARKKHLQDERFGLPIPDTVLKEEEEEERLATGGEDVEGRLNWDERDRARAAFEAVEERIGEVLADNLSGLGQYLSETWGW